jgi:hypothetical protein
MGRTRRRPGRIAVAHTVLWRVLSVLGLVLIGRPAPASDSAGFDPGTILEQATGLRPDVLDLALRAYGHARDSGVVRRAVLTIIDYELPSYEKRLWVIDMDSGRVLHEEWVAHGMGAPRGSGGTMTHALSFSNVEGTRKSSLGLFITAETYHGQHGHSLKLDGLEPGYNDHARQRYIVIHGAHYVTAPRAEKKLIGRSWGCPVLRPKVSTSLIDTIKEGSVLWVYYPDPRWLSESRFLVTK